MALYDTLAATAVLPSINNTVLVVMVEAFMASLKVTVTAVLIATFVVPLAGLNELTVGGVVSATVVNDELASAANALPAASLTPLAPLLTTIV